MNRIVTNNITVGAGMPFTSVSLNFLQDNYTNILNSILASPLLAGDNFNSSKPIGISGIRDYSFYFVGSAGYFTIPEGVVTYSGACYYYPGNDGTQAMTVYPQVPVVYLSNSYLGSDPQEFTDGNFYNVHQVNQIVIKGGIVGSGGDTALTYLCDLSNLTYLSTGWKQATLCNGWNNTSTREISYKKEVNKVYLRGLASQTATTMLGLTAFYLPIDCRPTTDRYLTGYYYEQNSPFASTLYKLVVYASTGQVIPYHVNLSGLGMTLISGAIYVQFDGLCFDID